jgi:hypothetical protein
MIDYKKIAIISVRILAISFILSGILELIMVVTAILLVSRGTIPQEIMAQEVWFLQSVIWIIGGTFLHFRSKSLGTVIVESLFGNDDVNEATNDVI